MLTQGLHSQLHKMQTAGTSTNWNQMQMQVEIAVKAGLVLVAVGVVRSLLGVRYDTG